MRIVKKKCMSCNSGVTLLCIEKIGEEIPPAFANGRKGVKAEDEDVGWWDAECPNCTMYYPIETVEKWVQRDIEAFKVNIESADDLKQFLRAIVRDCPEAREIIKSELSDLGYYLIPYYLMPKKHISRFCTTSRYRYGRRQ